MSQHETMFRSGSKSKAAAPNDDIWPKTTRLPVWLVATFIVVIWLLPVQNVYMPRFLPIETKPDRLTLIALAASLLGAALWRPSAIRRHGRPAIPTAIGIALWALVAIVIASYGSNISVISRDGEFQRVFRFSFQATLYVAAPFLTLFAVHKRDVGNLGRLFVAMATVAAIGTIWEAVSGTNLFYLLSRFVAVGGHVEAPAFEAGRGGRPLNVGPTAHSLAIASMLAMTVPLALMYASIPGRASRRMQSANYKLLVPLAIAMVLTVATILTYRRTGLILLAVDVVAVLLFVKTARRPAAIAVCLSIIFLPLVAPAAIKSISESLTGKSSEAQLSSAGRTSDYSAVAPAVEIRPALGGGLGSFGLARRVLDNQYLALLIETGVFGLVAYVGLLFASLIFMLRRGRGLSDREHQFRRAAAASMCGYLLLNASFDAFSFPQVPYCIGMLFALALAVGGDGERRCEAVVAGAASDGATTECDSAAVHEPVCEAYVSSLSPMPTSDPKS